MCPESLSSQCSPLRHSPGQLKKLQTFLTLILSNKKWVPCPLLLELACLCGYLMEAGVNEALPVSWRKSSETGSFRFLFLQLLILRAESACEKSDGPDGQATCRVLRLHGGEEWPNGVPTSSHPPKAPDV